jgi:hypothetical protein
MIPTLCISLGGSRLEVGLFDPEYGYRGGGIVRWRSILRSRYPRGASTAQTLAELAACAARGLIGPDGQKQIRSLNVGIAFPGPNVNGLWYSNNLTDDFRRGIPIDQVVRGAVDTACSPVQVDRVATVLDAQADAGGEIFHPLGSLSSFPHKGACVLNLATGVAAGFITVKSGESGQPFVLQSEEEFSSYTNGAYDANSGQVGRHLIVDIDGRTWEYCYLPKGSMVEGIPGFRLSDYISGPALASRLAQQLANLGLSSEVYGNEHLEWLFRESARICNENLGGARAHSDLVACVRLSERPISAEVLDWADRGILDTSLDIQIRRVLSKFRDDVAHDLGRALACWQSAKGWERFSRKIVLTGGVGQKAFVRTNAEFLSRMGSCLLEDSDVTRSKLENGCERVAWFFHLGVFGHKAPTQR